MSKNRVAGQASVCTQLLESSRPYALAVYREWRDKIASEDRRVLEALTMLLLQKRSVDGGGNRPWDASAHRFFSEAVDSFLSNMATSNKPGERICDPSAGSKYAPADGSQSESKE